MPDTNKALVPNKKALVLYAECAVPMSGQECLWLKKHHHFIEKYCTKWIGILLEINPFNYGRFAKSMDFFKSNFLLLLIACVAHQLSPSSFLSYMIIKFGHCFFPLLVEGADWLCQSATQASFLRFLVMKFWENALERVIFVGLLKSLFLKLGSLVYLGFLHKLLSWE